MQNLEAEVEVDADKETGTTNFCLDRPRNVVSGSPPQRDVHDILSLTNCNKARASGAQRSITR